MHEGTLPFIAKQNFNSFMYITLRFSGYILGYFGIILIDITQRREKLN